MTRHITRHDAPKKPGPASTRARSETKSDEMSPSAMSGQSTSIAEDELAKRDADLAECLAAAQFAATILEQQVARLATAPGNKSARHHKEYLRLLVAGRIRGLDRDPVAGTPREKGVSDLHKAAKLLEVGAFPDRRVVARSLINKCVDLVQGRPDAESPRRARGWLYAAAWLAETLPDYLPQQLKEPSTRHRAFVAALDKLRPGILPVLKNQGLNEANLLSDLLCCDEELLLRLSNTLPILRAGRELTGKRLAEKLFKETTVALGRPDVRTNWF